MLAKYFFFYKSTDYIFTPMLIKCFLSRNLVNLEMEFSENLNNEIKNFLGHYDIIKKISLSDPSFVFISLRNPIFFKIMAQLYIE